MVISVIDIILVAIVIYEFLALIRGTRAALILIGVSIIALAFYFSRVGELVTLNWLISRVLPYAVFALIVIFAPEIRQALARLVAHLRTRGYRLLDVQQWTPHTGRLGAIEIPRLEYLRRLAEAIEMPVKF